MNDKKENEENKKDKNNENKEYNTKLIQDSGFEVVDNGYEDNDKDDF